MLRLQKIISEAGIASRHQAEKLIKEGFVSVNGSVISKLGSKADPLRDQIKVKGKAIRLSQTPKVYILLYKPKGFITTLDDPEKRPLVLDLLKNKDKKFLPMPVGRLDFNTEGIILLTNDGELANQILHPRNKIPRTYLVKVKGMLEDKDIRKLEKGMIIDRKKTIPARAKKEHFTGKNSWFNFTLFEGRNKQIKNMCFNLGHPVLKLKRIKYAFLDLKGLKPGDYRYLTVKEVSDLKKLIINLPSHDK